MELQASKDTEHPPPSPSCHAAQHTHLMLVAGAMSAGLSSIPGMNTGGLSLEQLTNPKLDPSLFVPVCKFSDSFYRTAKNGVYALAGAETYQVRAPPSHPSRRMLLTEATQEYAPLIAGSLLRVRLEFCVLESFVYESIVPFIKARYLLSPHLSLSSPPSPSIPPSLPPSRLPPALRPSVPPPSPSLPLPPPPSLSSQAPIPRTRNTSLDPHDAS